MNNTLNKVLSLIEDRKVPKGEFLSALGLNRSTISDWKNEKSISYLKYLPQIASYFNVSLDWLAGNEQKNRPAVEHDELSNEILTLFTGLSEKDKTELIEYARYKVEHQSEK